MIDDIVFNDKLKIPAVSGENFWTGSLVYNRDDGKSQTGHESQQSGAPKTPVELEVITELGRFWRMLTRLAGGIHRGSGN